MAVATRTQAPVLDHPSTKHPEAPDSGIWRIEAPEARAGRQAEAPEAGAGRMNHLEQEFTHGRSQS